MSNRKKESWTWWADEPDDNEQPRQSPVKTAPEDGEMVNSGGGMSKADAVFEQYYNDLLEGMKKNAGIKKEEQKAKEIVGQVSPLSHTERKNHKPSLMAGQLFPRGIEGDNTLSSKQHIKEDYDPLLDDDIDEGCGAQPFNQDPSTDAHSMKPDASMSDDPTMDGDPHDYTQLTDEMTQRIQSGEHYLEVINDVARKYAQGHGSSYDAFDMAHDAFSRRAWEMGLWPNEDSEDASRKYDDYDVDDNDEYGRSRHDVMEKNKGLWANIHAKRNRGGKPAKPGDDAYPDSKTWKKLTKEDEELSEEKQLENRIEEYLDALDGADLQELALIAYTAQGLLGEDKFTEPGILGHGSVKKMLNMVHKGIKRRRHGNYTNVLRATGKGPRKLSKGYM